MHTSNHRHRPYIIYSRIEGPPEVGQIWLNIRYTILYMKDTYCVNLASVLSLFGCKILDENIFRHPVFISWKCYWEILTSILFWIDCKIWDGRLVFIMWKWYWEKLTSILSWFDCKTRDENDPRQFQDGRLVFISWKWYWEKLTSILCWLDCKIWDENDSRQIRRAFHLYLDVSFWTKMMLGNFGERLAFICM